MTRFVARVVVMFAANAVGLIVASLVLSGMAIDVTGFLIALVIFTVAVALLQTFFVGLLRGRGRIGLIGAALGATLVSLIVTDLISNGFSVDGPVAWLATTAIVWGTSVVAPFLALRMGVKQLEKGSDPN